MMTTPDYDRGFVAGLEYARMAVLLTRDAQLPDLAEHIDRTLIAAVADAELDPGALRRRLLIAVNHIKPPPRGPADVVDLAEWRKRNRRSHYSSTSLPAAG